jgi:hypothetical protein
MANANPKENMTPNEIKNYLDGAITQWRQTRDTTTEEVERTMAVHYIDAFQSVRVTLFGQTLQVDEDDLDGDPNGA